MTANFEAGFSVREAMWHGMGEVLADYPGRDEAIKLAGQDWTVDRRPLGILPVGTELAERDGATIAAGPVEVIGGWDALVRSDTGRVLYVAKDSYQPVQNGEMWNVLDALVDDPRVRYETAGVLKEGKQVWAMARVEGEWRVGGDDSPVVPFLTVVNSHDGTGSFRAMRNGIRVVCSNTVDLAIGEARAAGRLFTFKHSTGVMDRIEEAKAAIDGIVAAADAFVELGNELLSLGVSDGGRKLFLERFIPSPDAALVTDRALANIEQARSAVLSIIRGETGTVTPKQGESAYGLFQAGIEYLDHLRPARSAESRFNRALIEPREEKPMLLKLAREAASV